MDNPIVIKGGYNFTLQKFVDEDQFISNDQYVRFASENKEFMFKKKDFVWKSGVWRDEIQEPIWKNILKYKGKKLIIAHSDITTTNLEIKKLRIFGCNLVFGTNMYAQNLWATPLPTGLCDNEKNSPMHNLLSNRIHFKRAHENTEFRNSYDGSYYVNFTSGNNSKPREALMKIANNLPSRQLKISFPDFTERGRVKYLATCRSSSFVLCPEGNGIDTHRIWETLYMGGVPVILKNPAMESLVSDLPVITVNSWSEILESYTMRHRWENLRNKEYSLDKLKADYWKNKILTTTHKSEKK